MPIKYVCSNCGETIFEFKYVGQDYYGIPTPKEIYNLYGGICPHCHKELRLPSLEDIEIRPRLHVYSLGKMPASIPTRAPGELAQSRA
jgi:DNA-directed RNA polymerase subunit RPC12/RpoP